MQLVAADDRLQQPFPAGYTGGIIFMGGVDPVGGGKIIDDILRRLAGLLGRHIGGIRVAVDIGQEPGPRHAFPGKLEGAAAADAHAEIGGHAASVLFHCDNDIADGIVQDLIAVLVLAGLIPQDDIPDLLIMGEQISVAVIDIAPDAGFRDLALDTVLEFRQIFPAVDDLQAEEPADQKDRDGTDHDRDNGRLAVVVQVPFSPAPARLHILFSPVILAHSFPDSLLPSYWYSSGLRSPDGRPGGSPAFRRLRGSFW